MPGALTDQNFNEDIARGLRRRLPQLSIQSVREFGFAQAPDEQVLDLAASLGLVLLTHDAKTIQPLFYQHLAASHKVPFTVVVPERMAIGTAIDALELLFRGAVESDWSPPGLIRFTV